jgi:hypothetical protein
LTDVTNGQDQDGAELPAADEQLLRELIERARSGALAGAGNGGATANSGCKPKR